MSYLRAGRGGEGRRSVFYTSNSSAEEWELVDAPPKDFPEPKHQSDTHRRMSTSFCFSYAYIPKRRFFLFVCFTHLLSTVTH